MLKHSHHNYWIHYCGEMRTITSDSLSTNSMGRKVPLWMDTVYVPLYTSSHCYGWVWKFNMNYITQQLLLSHIRVTCISVSYLSLLNKHVYVTALLKCNTIYVHIVWWHIIMLFSLWIRYRCRFACNRKYFFKILELVIHEQITINISSQ